MEDLTRRQREVLDFVSASYDQTGVIPSYREVGRALGMKSTNQVSDHVKALIRKGYLERVGGAGRSRSLKLTPLATGTLGDDSVVGVPILGRIAAGTPLLAQENYEGTLRVDGCLLPSGGSVFALVVHGQSMIEDGIMDGDYLFVRQQSEARDGDIAVVFVDEEATVKRFYREGSQIRLQPANAAMDAIYVDAASGDVSVVGVAVGVYRHIH
ncbi:MAG: repressor LexA [Myxococcota bacterium]|jgi:repressor LexA